MKVYVATFHGDLASHTMEDSSPIVGTSLGDVLNKIVDRTGWGEVVEEHHDDWVPDYTEYNTLDPEDDKVEIWEYDGENNVAKLVCGFFGWHWNHPEEAKDMILPGHTESLYELAMTDY